MTRNTGRAQCARTADPCNKVIPIPFLSRPEPKSSARKETLRARLKCEVMAIQSSRDWEDPKWPRHKLCGEVIGTRSAKFIMARGHAYRIFRGRTHDRT